MSDTILVVNAGSSSIKFQLFAFTEQDQLNRLIKGSIAGIGSSPKLLVKDAGGNPLANEIWPKVDVGDLSAALDKIIDFLRRHIAESLPIAVGHRVVHGGPRYGEPIVIDETAVKYLEQLCPLAPLHQPNNIAPIRAVLTRRPHVFQVACFDTAFHRGHPEVADRFAIPEELYAEGVRRYGFHGLSYEYISKRLAEIAPDIASGRVVVAHLGNGASMCAIAAGKSVESTMGFTALDGLPMGSRSGQLDAGVVLYLLQQRGMSSKEVERFLYNDCGLKGMSGISSDVRELLASSDPRAKLALDYFVHRIALSAGMLASAMNGIDGFVFTAGIGENSPIIREAVLRRLGWLGIELDHAANQAGGRLISREGSRVACFVIPTDEELMIATHTLKAWRACTSASSKERTL